MQTDLASMPTADPLDARLLLFGRDPTPGIVRQPGRDGRATVWRRVTDAPLSRSAGVTRVLGEGASGATSRIVVEEDRFPSWLYLADASILDPLKPERLSRREVLDGIPDVPSGLAVVELEGPGVYRYLVLTTRPAEVEARALAAYRKRGGGTAPRGLTDLRGVAYARPLVEQYLAITGRTYFKGMAYDDLRRLQFDLETTGLDAERDRIFMISISDSTGSGCSSTRLSMTNAACLNGSWR